MKTIAILFALMLGSVAWAQDKPVATPEAVKPAAQPEAKPLPQQAAKPAVKPAVTPKVAAKKPGRRWHEDARACLEKPTNEEVIRCAEEYL